MIEEYRIELKESQHQYLQEMIEKYGIEDLSKAIRILVDYATEEKELETKIWEDERCLHCD